MIEKILISDNFSEVEKKSQIQKNDFFIENRIGNRESTFRNFRFSIRFPMENFQKYFRDFQKI